MVHAQEIFDLFEKSTRSKFKKRGTFLYRTATVGETVLTLCTGRLETFSIINESTDVVLKNFEIGSWAEEYVISRKKFEERYDRVEGQHVISGVVWLRCVAKGQVEAFQYQGETITFMAPWGEQMLCNPGDYMARPLGGAVNDIYRIEQETFLKTYSPL